MKAIVHIKNRSQDVPHPREVERLTAKDDVFLIKVFSQPLQPETRVRGFTFIPLVNQINLNFYTKQQY